MLNIIIIIASMLVVGASVGIIIRQAYHMGRAIGGLEASSKQLETIVPLAATLQYWTNRAHWEAIQAEEKPGIAEGDQADDDELEEIAEMLAGHDYLHKREKDRLDKADNA